MLRAERDLDRTPALSGEERLAGMRAGGGADARVLGVDLIALLAAVVLVQLAVGATSAAILVQGAACFLGLLLLGHYARRQPMAAELQQIAVVAGTVLIAFLLLRAVAGWPPADSGELLFAILATALLNAARLLAKAVLFRAGIWRLPTVLIGSPAHRDAIRPVIAQDWYVGHVVVAELDIAADVATLDASLSRHLPTDAPAHVIVAFDHDHSAAAEALVAKLDRRPTVSYDLLPPLPRLSFAQLSVRCPFGHDGLLLCFGRRRALARALLVKRLLDVVLASALIVLLAPLLLLLALLVRTDGGPALYGSLRLGRQGRRFMALKFRSMVPDAEAKLARLLAEDPSLRAEWERRFKLANDPRITPIGRMLRRTSLDELPQLFNVLKGEMSLVGPRPMLPEERAGYGELFAFYSQFVPGMTGVWQVSGRDDVPYERRISLNDWYLRNISVWNDLLILLKTAVVVLRRLGAS